tara:strand:- start:531 stop:872 length:342 start_codon:yes stop_codon:yes gene_type:complete
MAVIANLLIDAGASFSSDVNVNNDDGTPFDLTGYTVRGKMSKGYSSTNTRVFFDITLYEADGTVAISLDPTATAQLEDGRWVYDVEITNPADSTVTRIVEGIITVFPSVSSTI